MYGASLATSPNSRSTVRMRACASFVGTCDVDDLDRALAGTALSTPTRRTARAAMPCSATCIPPCGSRIISATRPSVPISCRSSGPGSPSSVGSCSVAVARRRSPATTSSMSLTDGSRPTRTGSARFGNSTESRSGRTGDDLRERLRFVAGADACGRAPSGRRPWGPAGVSRSLGCLMSTCTRLGLLERLRQPDGQHAVLEIGARARRRPPRPAEGAGARTRRTGSRAAGSRRPAVPTVAVR